MTPSDSFDPNSLPPFDCLCELCDCGCFEQSRQAHSISCKRFFNQSYEQRRQPKSPADTSCLSSVMSQRVAPRQGQLSEYQYQYLNAQNVSKESRTKMRDNIDIFSHNGKASDFRSPSSGFEPQMRSKVLDRLNRLMPNNPNVSWYKAENNFFGHDDVYKKNSGDAVTGPTLPGDRQKQDYLKNFEEYNRGFVDSYSEKRGAELVSTVLFRIILTVVIPWGESFLFLPKSLNSEKDVNSFPVHELLSLSLFTFTVTHFIFGPTCIEFLFIFYIGYILKFNWQVHPPYTINISLTQELKLCHCIIVEPASHFKLLPTSILDIYKVFDHIDIMSIGKQYQPNADTPTLLGSDLVVPGSFVDPK